MSYLKKIKVEVIPNSLPEVIRHCPKCGRKSHFINSKKFRVNANRNHIDIWLIYQCSKCKSTWNMTIYERIKPNAISKEEYDKFLANDQKQAMKYGFDTGIHTKNMSELVLENMEYHIKTSEIEEEWQQENEQLIQIFNENSLEIRMDKLLSEILGVSRNQIIDLVDQGQIKNRNEKNWLKKKAKNGISVIISTNLKIV